MNLTVPFIPHVFSNLFDTGSFSRIGFQFAKGNNDNLNAQPGETVTTPREYTYSYNCNIRFSCTFTSPRVQTEKDTVTQKTLFLVLNHDNTINAAIRNYKNYRLPDDCGQKFFRTLTFKTSVKLPSLTTGICFVRVKFKVTGEATYLQCVNI